MALPANTKLYLAMNGADASTTFTDGSSSPKTVTANGNAQIDTAQSKFGGASGLFDGTGDYLSSADSADYDFTGDFFISFWFKANVRAAYKGIIGAAVTSGGGTVYTGWIFETDSIDASHNPGAFVVYNGANTTPALNLLPGGATDIMDGNWHYLEVSRSGTSIKYFVDGTSVASGTYGSTISGTTGLIIGRWWNDLNQDYINGWVDDLIIVNGTAGHTANYTPPTEAWIVVADEGGGFHFMST